MGNTSSIVMASLGAAGSIVSGIFALNKANEAQQSVNQLQQDLINAEDSRQEIINPYSGVTNLSGTIKDMSSMIKNPYSNLRVATKASEMQAEEADLALANSLDTIRSTGAGAGGATALAQAALKSKQGISANIEQQEAQNEKLRAQGEMQRQQALIAEKRRVQQAQMSEGIRMQQADVAGQQFMWQQQEARDMQQLNRLQSQIDQQQQMQMNYQASAFGAFGDLAGGLMGVAGAMYNSNSNTNNNTNNNQDPYGNDLSINTLGDNYNSSGNQDPYQQDDQYSGIV